MWKSKEILWSLVIIFYAVCGSVDTACIIRASDKLPLFMKSFGTKKIMLPKDFRDIELDSGESIEAYCSSGISLKTDAEAYLKIEQGITAIEFYCNSTNLSYTKMASGDNNKTFLVIEQYPAYISCEKPLQQIYETKESLPNCEDYSSYAIGVTPVDQPDIITAGICYDLETLSPKYVTYMAHRPKYMFLEDKTNSTAGLPLSLNTKLSGFKELFRFISSDTFDKSFAIKKTRNPLLLLQEYDYSSLIQHPLMREELKDYEHMFNIIWWRNLRLGNWHYFMKALERRAEKVSYTIYTGTSGILSTPITSCERYEEFALQAEDKLIRAPAYIWTYLKSSYDEFVVIAFNSAFIGSKGPNFRCKDSCSDYDWISKSIFGRTHLISSLGLVYCCRIEEVANKLENFPIKITRSRPTIIATTTTTTTNTTNEAEMTETTMKATSLFKSRSKATN